MKRVLYLSLFLAVAGCDRNKQETSANNTPVDNAGKNTPADNTDKNERDRDGASLTPGDQGSSESDRTITQQIRQEVVKNDAVSMTGKNVKIITVDGVVTLRGPVKTGDEKTSIVAIAQGVPGVKRVDNQLEVAVN